MQHSILRNSKTHLFVVYHSLFQAFSIIISDALNVDDDDDDDNDNDDNDYEKFVNLRNESGVQSW